MITAKCGGRHISELVDKHNGERAHIIGAGPTAVNFADEYNGGIIIALNRMGVLPIKDYWLLFDPAAVRQSWYDEGMIMSNDESRIFADRIASNESRRGNTGFYEYSCTDLEVLSPLIESWRFQGSGGTVAAVAVHMCAIMGISEVYLHGIDLCMYRGRRYADIQDNICRFATVEQDNIELHMCYDLKGNCHPETLEFKHMMIGIIGVVKRANRYGMKIYNRSARYIDGCIHEEVA